MAGMQAGSSTPRHSSSMNEFSTPLYRFPQQLSPQSPARSHQHQLANHRQQQPSFNQFYAQPHGVGPLVREKQGHQSRRVYHHQFPSEGQEELNHAVAQLGIPGPMIQRTMSMPANTYLDLGSRQPQPHVHAQHFHSKSTPRPVMTRTFSSPPPLLTTRSRSIASSSPGSSSPSTPPSTIPTSEYGASMVATTSTPSVTSSSAPTSAGSGTRSPPSMVGWNPYYTPSSAAALALSLSLPTPEADKQLPLIVSSMDKAHSCPDCPKRFKRLEHLRRHQRTHTEEKPFFCDICERPFSRSDNLRVHRRTHLKNASRHTHLATGSLG